MQGQNQQQAYDRGITIFSPDGRLYQVEYAREAVKRGTACIGIRAQDGIVLAVEKRIRSELLVESSIEKLHKADDHIGIASSGHVADARQLIDFARQNAQINRLRFSEPIGVETLTKNVTDHIQQYTQVGGARPFGAALIIGGIDDGEPRLFETDPSGTPNEWKALAIGSNRSEIEDYLESEYSPDIGLDNAIELALEALAEVNDGTLTSQGVDVATVDAETEQYLSMADEEIQEYLTGLGILGEEDEE
ncbi:MAG: archaeal proteasome endopeptidase complex subunit alpha [Halobacteriaceae archaeon]